MKAEALVVDATLTLLFNGRSSRVSHSNFYTCDGPDGQHFSNTSKAMLIAVLRRTYERPVVLNVNDVRRRVAVSA